MTLETSKIDTARFDGINVNVDAKNAGREVSIGLATRYAEDSTKLSDEERTRVEEWMEKYPRLRRDVEYLRKNRRFFNGSMSLSDI